MLHFVWAEALAAVKEEVGVPQGASQSSSPYNEAWKTSEARAAQAFTKTPSHPIFSGFSSNSSEQKQKQRHQIQNETLKCFGFRPCVGNHSSDIDTRGRYLRKEFESRITNNNNSHHQSLFFWCSLHLSKSNVRKASRLLIKYSINCKCLLNLIFHEMPLKSFGLSNFKQVTFF